MAEKNKKEKDDSDLERPQTLTSRVIYSHFFKFLEPYKSLLIQGVVVSLLVTLIQASIPMITKYVIDDVLSGDKSNRTILFVIGIGVLVIYAVKNLLGVMASNLVLYVGTRCVFDVRKKMFDHLQMVHLAFYEKEQSGKLISRLLTDVMSLQALIQSSVVPSISATLNVIVALSLMFSLNVRLTLWSFFVTPMWVILVMHFRRKLRRESMNVREKTALMTGNISEVITGVKIVRSFAQEDREKARFGRMIEENMRPELQLGFDSSTLGGALDLTTGLGVAIIMCLGGMEVLDGRLSIGGYVAFSTYLWSLFMPLLTLIGQFTLLVRAQAGLERIILLLEVKPEIVEPEKPVILDNIQGQVVFENVNFAYAPEVPVIHDFNLTVEPGEVIGLVGPSGSGKSTCINLLTRFYDPSSGRILVDGVDMRELDLKVYRRQTGIVLQDPFLFTGSIRDNILYGKPEASQEELEKAARQANAYDFIMQLSKGFDTEVGERGAMLSGGQRQRISIARALLKNPRILILDEATSSLDTESERLVREALDTLMAGRTVFIVAHRFSTIQSADRIVVLEEGRIVEIGNHHQLLGKKGLYHRLYYSSEDGVTKVAV